MNNNKEVLLKLRGLKTYFPIKKGVFKKTIGYIKAVDGIDIDIYKGEIIAVVGESGCGKTTLGLSILQLVEGAKTEGEIIYNFDGIEKDLRKLSNKEMMNARKKLQIIFQNPYSTLNPIITIFGSFQDPLKKIGVKLKEERRKKIGELLEAVNLRREYMNKYPNEFSGGERQRIGIARALSVEPELIICDEPVSSLDVSIQAQVLKLLKELKEKRNLTYVFITHDLSVVEYISDRIVVMYLGKIVELTDAEELYAETLHPYTKALLSAIPVTDLDNKLKRIVLKGDVPSPINPPSGCPFHPRCKECKDICKKEVPKLKKYMVNRKEHFVACHLVEDKY